MNDYSELKRLADAAPTAMTMTNGGEEHKALIAFTDEVKRLFGNDVGMARVLIAEIEVLREQNADGLAVLRTQRAQLDCYIKDAERYRWLREQEAERGVCIINVGEWTAGATCIATTFHSAEFADEMVDAAMSKED